MTTAVALASNVYRQANMDQALTSFSTSQTFPYNIALDLLNEAIDELNEKGRYRFMMTSTALSYPPPDVSGSAYSLSTVGVDSEGLVKIERTATNFYGEICSMNLDAFRKLYRRQAIQSGIPTVWTDYGDVLELNTAPDQDYSLVAFHYPIITRMTATSDTIAVPERHEHIIQDLMLAYLAQRLGRPDYQDLYVIAINKADKMLVNTQRLRSRPTRMPAAF